MEKLLPVLFTVLILVKAGELADVDGLKSFNCDREARVSDCHDECGLKSCYDSKTLVGDFALLGFCMVQNVSYIGGTGPYRISTDICLYDDNYLQGTGLAFNLQDEQNYDIVYKADQTESSCVRGFVFQGVVSILDMFNCPATTAQKIHSFSVLMGEEGQYTVTVKDEGTGSSVTAGPFPAHFPRRAQGGVAMQNDGEYEYLEFGGITIEEFNVATTTAAPTTTTEEEIECYTVCEGGVPSLLISPVITPGYVVDVLEASDDDGLIQNKYIILEGNIEHEDEHMYLDITWYVHDGAGGDVILQTEESVPYNDLPTVLHERVWRVQHGLSLPLTVYLNMTAYYSPFDKKFSNTVTAEYWMGFKVDKTQVEVSSGSTEKVNIWPTVPILCPVDLATGLDVPCVLYVYTTQPPEDGATDICSPKLTYLRVRTDNGTDKACVIEVPQILDVTSQPQVTLSITGVLNNAYDPDRSLTVEMRTSSSHPEHLAWQDYQLPTLQVKVTDAESQLKNSFCSITNDPHMQTFDGRAYEMQMDGSFIIYRHQELPIEIHGYFINRGRYSSLCGASIRSGGDLFIFDMCGPYRFRMYECGEERLRVIKTGTYRYEITFPTGMKMELQNGRMRLYPSVRDIGLTEGLCGLLDFGCDEEYIMRDGSFFTDTKAGKCDRGNCPWRCGRAVYPNVWSNDWRVTETENYYYGDIQIPASLPADLYPGGETFCGCPSDGVEQCGIFSDCRSGSDVAQPLGKMMDECLVRNAARRRRSADDGEGGGSDDVEDEVVMFPFDPDRAPEVVDCTDPWTEVTAGDYCEEKINQNPDLQPCYDEDIITDPGISVEECVADICLTGSTEFVDQHIAQLVDTCREGALRTVSLYTVDGEGEVKPPLAITGNLCPDMCSDHGTCNEGKCTCNPDYSGEDCAIYLKVVPVLQTVSHCDLKSRRCLQTPIRGEDFLELDTLGCKFDVYRLTRDNTLSTLAEEVVTTAHYDHGARILCDFPDTGVAVPGASSSDDWFTMAYRVSVTNDGDKYSEQKLLLIIDTQCMECDIEGICRGKAGTCVANGRCCTQDETSIALIVGAVLGSVAAVAVAVLVAAFIYKKFIASPKIGSSTKLNGTNPWHLKFDSGHVVQEYNEANVNKGTSEDTV